MAEAFPVSGNIEPVSFPHLLVDLHRHGATGSLKVSGPAYPKQLFFRAGRILFGSSNDPKDHLGTILIESGRITKQQFDEVNSRLSPGNPLAKVLEESGFVNRREINEAARTKVERILADILTWDAGSFEFEDGVLPKGAVDLKLSTERLLLEATRRVGDRSFALRHLSLSTVLEPAPASDGALAEVRSDVAPLLEQLDGKRTLREAIALTRLDEFEGAKTACAMLFLGIVQKKEAGGEVDLAEEVESGLGDEPLPSAPAHAAAPLPEATGFDFSETETPGFPALDAEAEAPGAAETVVFEPQPEPEPFVVPDREPEPFPEVVPAEPAPLPDASTDSFAEMPWERPSVEAVPADEPIDASPPWARPPVAAAPAIEPDDTAPPAVTIVQQPPPPPPEPAPAPQPEPVLPEGPVPAPSSRPTREDLAALDALLSPSASGRLPRTPVERPAPARPPELSGTSIRPATVPPRRPPARIAPAGSSRVPYIAIILVCVLATTIAAWYFFLRSPQAAAKVVSATPVPVEPVSPAPTPPPATEPTAEAPATPAAVATPTAAPTAAPTVAPTAPPAATPVPAPTPIQRPTPTPAARTTPPPVGASSGGAGDARALLSSGALSDAARAFAASIAPEAKGHFSYQVLVACDPANVQKAVSAVPEAELFILPVNVKGKACYRLCWGVYEGRPAAEAAFASLPSYFRQGGTVPRLSPLPELLP